MQQSFRLSACHEEPERRAFAHSALDTEAEAVLLENGLGDGQAEAGAFDIFVFMFLEAVEPFGQALQIFSRNRYAGIGNADFNRFAFGHIIKLVFGNGWR